jgi:hypothetical protein
MNKRNAIVTGVLAASIAGCSASPTPAEPVETAESAVCGNTFGCISTTPWTGNAVFYAFDNSGGTFTSAEQAAVQAAMGLWTQATAGTVTFTQASHSPQLTIVKNSARTFTTWSNGSPTVNLQQTYLSGDQRGNQAIAHELGHAQGLPHQQQRNDRDRYLVVNEGNVGAGKDANGNEIFCTNAAAPTYNDTWSQCQPTDPTFGVFDFGSIMLYEGG